MCETGGARRTWLRGLEKINKRYKMVAAARNLGLLMRALFGIGKPRCLQPEGLLAVFALLISRQDQYAFEGLAKLSALLQGENRQPILMTVAA